jgi:CcmD family protein
MSKEGAKGRGVRGRVKSLLISVALGSSAALFAQTPEQFEVVKGAPTESLPAVPLVFIGYAFVWVVVFLYVAMLWKRIGRVEHELREIASKPQAPSLKART